MKPATVFTAFAAILFPCATPKILKKKFGADPEP
jgi:hypothetical protein